MVGSACRSRSDLPVALLGSLCVDAQHTLSLVRSEAEDNHYKEVCYFNFMISLKQR